MSGESIVGQRYRWEVSPVAPLDLLDGVDGVHRLAVQLLWNRGIREPDEIRRFLDGSPVALGPPRLMLGMDRAVSRLLEARASGEAVVVYGDYDVDGVTSTVLLTECLRAIGLRTEPFVPRRDVDGYGLSSAALERLRTGGAGLVVAVDCGISGGPEIERARQAGLSVIVADHHHVPATLPNAAAVINPKQPGCSYPFKELCAVGLAYQLARALLEAVGMSPAGADQWLDLVALGTVADVVPLLGENRSLVLGGLPLLNQLRRPGLRALAQRAGLRPGQIDARAIAFALAPRLNAAGRLDDAMSSVRLLRTSDESEAQALADSLDGLNRERQRLTAETLAQIVQNLPDRAELPKLLLLADEQYHAGVVGLVAARLAEEFCRPALVAALADGVARGSARSVEGFHVAEALARCADVLSRHGGHARAAGFTVPSQHLDELRRRLETFAAQQLSDAAIEPSLAIDAPITLRKYGDNLLRLVDQLEPFGHGNPVPVFLASRLRIVAARVVGRDRPGHLKLRVHDGVATWDVIGFGMGDRLDELASGGDRVDIVFSVERHEWEGETATRLRLRDLRSSVPES